MKLISVENATHTVFANAIDLTLTADLGDGVGNQSLQYTWAFGDPYGLGPQIDAFMAANPTFPIAAYVAPIIDFTAADIAAINVALAQPGSLVRALGLLFLQEINVLRVKTGLVAYTQAQLVAALQAKIR